jgi:NADH-quinone oxidoreductase subunit L
MNFEYTLFIILLPFLSFLITGLTGMKYKPIWSGIIGTVSLGLAFSLSWFTAIEYFFAYGKDAAGVFQKITAINFNWLQLTSSLHIDMGIMLDPISVMMLVVVTTVSFMAHIYSIGYMHGEDGFARFFAFLSLFSFSMLGLVVATNLFQMYIFWELVGVSSFLLIGYYYQKPAAVSASKKAFIVTRFADLGFLIGILILSYFTKTFDFKELISPNGPVLGHPITAVFMGTSVLVWSMILIFVGGAGKSAMFPLHIWLPDAMEGPTPVSALIHAATMVVAGVYLVARLIPIYAIQAPAALEVVGYVGAFSSLFAAIIATTQFDIKRVLAFSTMSQIGYMMVGLGMSGYGGHEGLGFMASMFHLFTHAMFKALLFLGAGAIIHAVHTNYMNEMGGLWKKLPITHATFLIATLTIAGFPGLSAFFSKDEILVAAFHHNKLIFFNQMFVAGLTAFYMFRLYFRVFWNKTPHYHHEPHESPLTMTIPLMFLAFMAIVSGYIPFEKLVTSDGKAFETHTELIVMIPAVLVGFVGIGIAWVMYKKETSIPDRISKTLRGVYTTIYHKFYIDEAYMFITHKIMFNSISRPIAWFDRKVIDATMDGIGKTTEISADKIKGLQSGQLQKYAFVFVTGVVILLLTVLYLVG